MRSHDIDADRDPRPKGDRIDRAEPDLLGPALAARRPKLLGRSGLLDLQRSAGNAGVGALLEEQRSSVHQVIGSVGTPLEPGIRQEMEARFHQAGRPADFGDVRVHTDGAAGESARSVGALAYTVGSDIVFQREHYDPSSTAGRHTLAHELTHVLQQREGPVEGTENGAGIKVSDPGDRFEREAVATADRLLAAPAPQRETAPQGDIEESTGTAPTSLQRETESGEEDIEHR
ncbi:eCIS core domain-containing protein [Amycolatopsis taiwanensis]|uniref:eCIS core domain-containing protein n=1 Tax=Amycolatopsis taiwanensis TaxID=342230 RepID=A0A9W6R5H8_9PSEU|nr:DUF4157 domain-containing protein [Amycolatopsis taiwanensis]GLY69043.1 hypothetical protein Atai01_56620 [Amycolatopsis taiwanensis]